jgi:hypothetical protein
MLLFQSIKRIYHDEAGRWKISLLLTRKTYYIFHTVSTPTWTIYPYVFFSTLSSYISKTEL